MIRASRVLRLHRGSRVVTPVLAARDGKLVRFPQLGRRDSIQPRRFAPMFALHDNDSLTYPYRRRGNKSPPPPVPSHEIKHFRGWPASCRPKSRSSICCGCTPSIRPPALGSSVSRGLGVAYRDERVRLTGGAMALQCAKTRFETADGEVSSARTFSLVCSKRANNRTRLVVSAAAGPGEHASCIGSAMI